MAEKLNSAKQVNDVLSQLHESGAINLDKSVREVFNPTALAELQPGSTVASSVIAWDGYAVVIASAVNDLAELGNVAGQLRQAAGG